MQQNVISLSVPADDKDAIQAAATMFNYLVTLKGGFDKLPESAKQTAPSAPAQPPKAQDLTVEVVKVEDGATAPATAPESEDDDGSEWPKEVNGVKLDSQGLPWDARVDSSNQKCRKSDGIWTPKRGVDKALYDQVKAEIAAAMQNAGKPVEQAQEQYNASQAFTPQQQAPATTNAAPQITDTASFARAVSKFNGAQQAAVASAYGWPTLFMAASVVATNPAIFDEVLARLAAEAGK